MMIHFEYVESWKLILFGTRLSGALRTYHYVQMLGIRSVKNMVSLKVLVQRLLQQVMQMQAPMKMTRKQYLRYNPPFTCIRYFFRIIQYFFRIIRHCQIGLFDKSSPNTQIVHFLESHINII